LVGSWRCYLAMFTHVRIARLRHCLPGRDEMYLSPTLLAPGTAACNSKEISSNRDMGRTREASEMFARSPASLPTRDSDPRHVHSCLLAFPPSSQLHPAIRTAAKPQAICKHCRAGYRPNCRSGRAGLATMVSASRAPAHAKHPRVPAFSTGNEDHRSAHGNQRPASARENSVSSAFNLPACAIDSAAV
jgi:hypothetical protein